MKPSEGWFCWLGVGARPLGPVSFEESFAQARVPLLAKRIGYKREACLTVFALLKQGPSTVEELSTRGALPRETARAALWRLHTERLAFLAFPYNPEQQVPGIWALREHRYLPSLQGAT